MSLIRALLLTIGLAVRLAAFAVLVLAVEAAERLGRLWQRARPA